MTQIDLKIEKMNLGAQGIGYLDGKVCFVDFVIPGEEIRAVVIVKKKDYNVAKVLEIFNPSPARIKPNCPVFELCGGCQMQHIDYKYQVELKKAVLIDTLRRIGKFDIQKVEVVYEKPWYYRNRAQLPIQNNKDLKIGYFKKGTHEVVNHDCCHINQLEINQVTATLRRRLRNIKIDIYDESRHSGNLRHIIVRRGTNTGQIFITFVTKEKRLPEEINRGLIEEIPDIVGISQNINNERTNRILGRENIILVGNSFYEELVAGKKFQIAPTSFFQVNTEVFEKVIEKIRQEIEGRNVVDLYAGVGVIGICVADLCQRIIAIEQDQSSVKDGIRNAGLNKVSNIEFIIGKAEDKIGLIDDCETLILDPPRKGVGEIVINHLVKINVKKIIYLSCNPATLARDAGLILKKGYYIKKLYFFDMFPQTYHIESLMVFEKRLHS